MTSRGKQSQINYVSIYLSSSFCSHQEKPPEADCHVNCCADDGNMQTMPSSDGRNITTLFFQCYYGWTNAVTLSYCSAQCEDSNLVNRDCL